MFKNLETERLILKNINYEDNDFMYKEFSCDQVNKYLFDAEPIKNIEEANEWIKFYTKSEPRLQHRYIIILKSNFEKIGTIGFHCWDKLNRTIEIGYDLQPDYWRNGYTSEALKEMLSYINKEMKVKALFAHIAVDNIASIKTAEKQGFRKSDKSFYLNFHGKDYLHYVYQLNN